MILIFDQRGCRILDVIKFGDNYRKGITYSTSIAPEEPQTTFNLSTSPSCDPYEEKPLLALPLFQPLPLTKSHRAPGAHLRQDGSQTDILTAFCIRKQMRLTSTCSTHLKKAGRRAQEIRQLADSPNGACRMVPRGLIEWCCTDANGGSAD